MALAPRLIAQLAALPLPAPVLPLLLLLLLLLQAGAQVPWLALALALLLPGRRPPPVSGWLPSGLGLSLTCSSDCRRAWRLRLTARQQRKPNPVRSASRGSTTTRAVRLGDSSCPPDAALWAVLKPPAGALITSAGPPSGSQQRVAGGAVAAYALMEVLLLGSGSSVRLLPRRLPAKTLSTLMPPPGSSVALEKSRGSFRLPRGGA